MKKDIFDDIYPNKPMNEEHKAINEMFGYTPVPRPVVVDDNMPLAPIQHILNKLSFEDAIDVIEFFEELYTKRLSK